MNFPEYIKDKILTILMQILHWCKINVFKVVVLMGTFALALALPAMTW